MHPSPTSLKPDAKHHLLLKSLGPSFYPFDLLTGMRASSIWRRPFPVLRRLVRTREQTGSVFSPSKPCGSGLLTLLLQRLQAVSLLFCSDLFCRFHRAALVFFLLSQRCSPLQKHVAPAACIACLSCCCPVAAPGFSLCSPFRNSRFFTIF